MSTSPIVTFDGIAYTITLERDGKMIDEFFGEHRVNVCACYADGELATWERSQIKGDAAANGIIYYIHAQPYDVGLPLFVWLKDKEEAVALRKALFKAEGEEEEEEDAFCTFCGKRPSTGCSEDHGDDERDAQKAALSRD
jgi:hypothetical protein